MTCALQKTECWAWQVPGGWQLDGGVAELWGGEESGRQGNTERHSVPIHKPTVATSPDHEETRASWACCMTRRAATNRRAMMSRTFGKKTSVFVSCFKVHIQKSTGPVTEVRVQPNTSPKVRKNKRKKERNKEKREGRGEFRGRGKEEREGAGRTEGEKSTGSQTGLVLNSAVRTPGSLFFPPLSMFEMSRVKVQFETRRQQMTIRAANRKGQKQPPTHAAPCRR